MWTEKLILWVHSWYPLNCCSDKDCRPVSCDFLQTLIDNGRVAKNIIMSSPDMLCHLCTNINGNHVCAFIPQALF